MFSFFNLFFIIIIILQEEKNCKISFNWSWMLINALSIHIDDLYSLKTYVHYIFNEKINVSIEENINLFLFQVQVLSIVLLSVKAVKNHALE